MHDQTNEEIIISHDASGYDINTQNQIKIEICDVDCCLYATYGKQLTDELHLLHGLDLENEITKILQYKLRKEKLQSNRN